MNAGPAAKRDRQRAIREIIVRDPIGNQQELAERLVERGFAVTQATVSRDIAELGIVKVPRGDRHLYVSTEDVAAPPRATSDERLRRILADIPVTVGRSGLILLVTGSPGTASVIAQAIDESDEPSRKARSPATTRCSSCSRTRPASSAGSSGSRNSGWSRRARPRWRSRR